MILCNKEMLDEYAKDDVVLHLLDEFSGVRDDKHQSQRWLRESMPKRMIYHKMYGDLLFNSSPMRILDVGGGYTGLTRLLYGHRYGLLDLIKGCDWIVSPPPPWDIIIANDLFPNNDQRLSLFLGKYLPLCKEMRLSLTFFDKPKWYRTKRVDGGEILTMLSWRKSDILLALAPYVDKSIFSVLVNSPSIFPNGRQVLLVTLKND